MNQDYRGRVKRHLEAGGDPKYVNVKKKAEKRHEMSSKMKGYDIAGMKAKFAKGFGDNK